MIQRIQSIRLFLAAVLNAGVFYFDLYRWHINFNGADTISPIKVGSHFPSVILAVVITVMPLVTIFMFKKRKKQKRMAFISIFAVLGFIGMVLARVRLGMPLKPPATSGTYWIGAVLPAAGIVFIILAIIGINKDEKLVRSVDRLR